MSLLVVDAIPHHVETLAKGKVAHDIKRIVTIRTSAYARHRLFVDLHISSMVVWQASPQGPAARPMEELASAEISSRRRGHRERNV